MSGRDIDELILDELWRSYGVSSRHVASSLDMLMGCSLPQFLVMRALVTAEGTMVVTDVAKVMGCARSNVGPIAKRLQELTWITRADHPWDARVVSLRATPSGKRNYEMLAAEVLRAAHALLSELDEEEKYNMLAVLRKIRPVNLE